MSPVQTNFVDVLRTSRAEHAACRRFRVRTRQEPGITLGMTAQSGTPLFEDVVADLKKVREKSLGAVRRLNLPALHAATLAAGISSSELHEPAAVEELLRKAVGHLGGGSFQESAEYTFGLVPGYKVSPATERRRQAAKAMNVAPDTFRKDGEKLAIEQVAEGVLALCLEQSMRVAHLQMEHRHPADTRLAVAWVERFEAYYKLWTPIYALGADLKAAIQTYGEEPADHLPWDPTTEESFDPVKEAQGYARSALYWYAAYHLELKRFMRGYGGLWLFSSTETESRVSEALMRIGWHNPMNEEDESWLRRKLADCRHEEAEQFYRALQSSGDGERIHALWQQFVLGAYQSYDSLTKVQNQVRNTIEASESFCAAVDEDWIAIADWYAPGSRAPRTFEASDLYGQLVDANKSVSNRKSD